MPSTYCRNRLQLFTKSYWRVLHLTCITLLLVAFHVLDTPVVQTSFAKEKFDRPAGFLGTDIDIRYDPFLVDSKPVAELPQSLDPVQFIELASVIAGPYPSLQNSIKVAEDGYFIIFIHGILGSKLTDPVTKTVIWGETPAPTVHSLKLKSQGPKAIVGKLQAYPHPLGLTREDVYGEFDKELSGVVGGTAQVEEFSYDWRQDLDVVTNDLETMIRRLEQRTLKHKRLIIIAHSMGGLVAWNWKSRFYEKGRYDFYFWRLVVVGSPIEGSCEILRMLLTGYRPLPNARFTTEKIYEYLFSSLKAAAFTFPSVFQLLPRYDESQPCLVIKYKSGVHAQNHFSVDVWKTLLPLLKVKDGILKEVPVNQVLGLTPEVFLKELEALLAKAQRFRHRLDLSAEGKLEGPLEGKLKGQVTYFYGDQYQTTARIQLDNTGTIIRYAEGDTTYADGDGRVLVRSAMNGTRYVEVPRPLESEHSALVKDERFLPFIRLDLRRWVQIDTGAAVGRLLLADAPARKAFAEGRYVLHASPEGGDEQALKVFLALNLTTLERMKREETNPDYATEQFGVNAIRYASYLKNTYPEDKEMLQRALPLYETALASGELTLIEQAHALNQYGQGLYAVGHPSEAVYVYRSALLKIQRQHAMPWLFDPLHADLLVNLSKSYDALGQKWQAKLARDEAKGYKGTRVEAWVPNTGEMSGL